MTTTTQEQKEELAKNEFFKTIRENKKTEEKITSAEKFLQILQSYKPGNHDQTSHRIGEEINRLFGEQIKYQEWPKYTEYISLGLKDPKDLGSNILPEHLLSLIIDIDQHHEPASPDWLGPVVRQWLDQYFMQFICLHNFTAESFDLSYPNHTFPLFEELSNQLIRRGLHRSVSEWSLSFQSSNKFEPVPIDNLRTIINLEKLTTFEVLKCQKIESTINKKFTSLKHLPDQTCNHRETTLIHSSGVKEVLNGYSNKKHYEILSTLKDDLFVFQINPKPKRGDPPFRMKYFKKKTYKAKISHIEVNLSKAKELEHLRKDTAVNFLNSLVSKLIKQVQYNNNRIELVFEKADLSSGKLCQEARHLGNLFIEMKIEAECFYRKKLERIHFNSNVSILIHGSPHFIIPKRLKGAA